MTNKHIKDTKFKCYQRDTNEHLFSYNKGTLLYSSEEGVSRNCQVVEIEWRD